MTESNYKFAEKCSISRLELWLISIGKRKVKWLGCIANMNQSIPEQYKKKKFNN